MKKRSPGESPPLSQFWNAPGDLLENGVGEPSVCLCSTFELEASFLEDELLPRFLGLRFDHAENEPVFIVEREDKLAMIRAAVLVDESRFDPRQTALRWNQIPVRIPGGIQHSKVVVLAWERCIRVIVGSANLTRKGYRRNREVFAALDFWNSPNSVPLTLLKDALSLFDAASGWVRGSPSSIDRLNSTLEFIRSIFRRWEEAPADFTPRQRPQARLVLTKPSGPGGRRSRGRPSTKSANLGGISPLGL